MPHAVTTVEQLERIYGAPNERALWKEIDFLNEDYQAFVKASPLIILATAGDGGTDCSPKGDFPGFVKILDARTLAVPDRPGNNRIDTLRNILLICGYLVVSGARRGETLRVNGRAEITGSPELLATFKVDRRLPRTVIVVKIDSAYFHCSKAFMRSDLWNPEKHVERSNLPSPGAMHKRLTGGAFDAVTYDRELPERVKAGLH